MRVCQMFRAAALVGLGWIALPTLHSGQMPPPPERPQVRVKLNDGTMAEPAEDASRYQVGSDTGLFHPHRKPPGYSDPREGVVDGRHDLEQSADLSGSPFGLPLVDPKNAEKLAKALKDLESTNPATRKAAVKSLVELGPMALSGLLRGTYDDDLKMRKGAFQALLDVVAESKKLKIEALDGLDHALAVPRLVEGLQDKNKEVRAICRDALVRMGDTQALQPLIRLLVETHDESGADEIADVTSQLIHPPHVNGLVSTLIGSGKVNAQSIKRALVKMKSMETKKLADFVAATSSPLGESLAGRILALRAAAEAVPVLTARQAAGGLHAGALVWHEISRGLAGDAAALDALAAHLDFKGDWGVRLESIRALKAMKPQGESQRKVIPLLIVRQKDYYLAVRVEANAALVEITQIRWPLNPDAGPMEMARLVKNWEDWWTDRSAEGAVDLKAVGAWKESLPLTWFEKAISFGQSTHKTVPPIKTGVFQGVILGKKFSISDDNDNGFFNDYGQDGLKIEGLPGGFLSRIVPIDGQYHMLEVTTPEYTKKMKSKGEKPTAGSFRTAPYTGPVGSLKILATYAKGTTLDRLILRSGSDVVFTLDKELDRKLPSGIYRIYEGYLSNKMVAPDAKISAGTMSMFEVQVGLEKDAQGNYILLGLYYVYGSNETDARAQALGHYGANADILSIRKGAGEYGAGFGLQGDDVSVVNAETEKTSLLMLGPGKNRGVRVGDAYGRKAQLPLGQPLSLDIKVSVEARAKGNFLVLEEPTFYGRRFGENYYDGNPQPKSVQVKVFTAQEGKWVEFTSVLWNYQQAVNLLGSSTTGSGAGKLGTTLFERSDKWLPLEIDLKKYNGDLRIQLTSSHPLLGDCEEVVDIPVNTGSGDKPKKINPQAQLSGTEAASILTLSFKESGRTPRSISLKFECRERKRANPLPPAVPVETESGYKVSESGEAKAPPGGVPDSSHTLKLTAVTLLVGGAPVTVTGDGLGELSQLPLELTWTDSKLELKGFEELSAAILQLKPFAVSEPRRLPGDPTFWKNSLTNLWHWNAGAQLMILHDLEGRILGQELVELKADGNGLKGVATSVTEATDPPKGGLSEGLRKKLEASRKDEGGDITATWVLSLEREWRLHEGDEVTKGVSSMQLEHTLEWRKAKP